MTLPRFFETIARRSDSHTSKTPCVVALGDSVTEGCMALDVFDFDGVYHQQWRRLMIRQYPRVPFNVINSGVAGGTAEQAVTRLQRDVLAYHPDLVLIGFGLNDSGEGDEGLGEFHAHLLDIGRHIRAGTEAELVFLTSNFMNHAETVEAAPPHRHLIPQFASRQRSGLIGRYAQVVREVADALACPLADVYRDWERLRDSGIDTDPLLSNGLNHPTAAGHTLAARRLMRTILPHWQPPPDACGQEAEPLARCIAALP